MSIASTLAKRIGAVATVIALVASGVVVSAALAPAALADPQPVSQPLASTATADALPTAQIDGVVWSQAIVGNTVYAGGQFNNARPAGAAAGTNLTPRGNLLAYNINDGTLVTSFAPSLNGVVKSVAASPDGSRIYVGGTFTAANGATRYRVAAYSTATGALVANFNPAMNGPVYTIAVSNTTVYLGGSFTTANGVARTRLAAFQVSNGALTAWNASTDYNVNTMVLTPDGSRLIVGGGFQNVNGAIADGLAALDATTGTLLPWAANRIVTDGGLTAAAILSLRTDGKAIYGTGYVFGNVNDGNLEGTFSADPNTGTLNWIEDCHGDTYDSYSDGSTVYTVSHAHYCGAIGGFPQSDPWTTNMKHAVAFTAAATGTLSHDIYAGGTYFDWQGTASPTMLNWFPDVTVGTFTGQTQAAWDVTGNGKYVVMGGEFPSVNFTAQQGLVRFATRPTSPGKQGPRVSGANFVPTAVSLRPGSVRLSFQANWDRDDITLTYKIVRDNNTAAPISTQVVNSTFWNMPMIGYVDTGLAAGSTHTYKIVATDPWGNTVTGNPVTATVNGTATTSAYSADVLAGGATSFWPLSEPSANTTASYDYSGFNDLKMNGTITRGAAGSTNGDPNTATTFDGVNGTFGATASPIPGPNTFTLEAWIKTTTTAGGKIAGFGNQNTVTSSNYDRHLYMDPAGKVNFGVYNNGSYIITSSSPLNDGQWHYVVGTLSSTGMVMYVDGRRAGTNSGTNVGQDYSGYWRVGGDSSWAGSNFFAGSIDDVAVYPTALNLTTVQQHYTDSGRTVVGAAPTDAYGKAVFADSPDVYYRMDEAAGPGAVDSSGSGDDGTYFGTNGETYRATSPVTGATGSAVTFNGAEGSNMATGQVFNNPTVYSEELWFNTTTTNGGKLIGFGNARSGRSSAYDRHVYMEGSGQLTFGTYTGQLNTTTSSQSFNDGKWHYLVATQASDGMKLYVDGVQVGTNPQTSAQAYSGYWRIGGDTAWNGTAYFAGTIDEAAVYSSELTPAQINAHYQASPAHRSGPVAKVTATVTDLVVAANASGSTVSDGSTPTYAWTFGDSATATGVSPTHTYAAPGTYQITVTVTDGTGLTGTASTSVTVAAHVAPTASFTASSANLVGSFDASASKAATGSTISAYSWNFGDGTTGTGVTATHTYAAGSYLVTLTVTDNTGVTGTATQTVVAAQHASPTASFTATPSGAGASFDATASSAADGATVTGYAWDFGDGGTASGLTASHTWTTFGDHTVKLTVTDSQLAVGSTIKTVTTTHAAPTARFTQTSNNLVVTFDGSTSTAADGATVTGYAWDFGDGATSTVATPTHTYATGQSYPVQLTVTDSLNSTGTVSATVTVGAHPAPTAVISSTATSLTVAFDGTGSGATDAATVTGYAWTFGDGGTATTSKPSHAYASSGSYPVTLTVTDSKGGSATATKTVTVTHTAPVPVISATPTGLSVAFDGTGSSASDLATISSYSWDFGDGGTSTIAQPTHAYAASGTFTVTLTVTDSLTGTATTTRAVTVSPVAQTVLASDTFARTSTNKWGVATTGGTWATVGSAALFSTTPGVGKISLALGSGPAAYLPTVASADVDVVADASTDKAITGGGMYLSLAARHSSAGDYRARVKLIPSAVQISVTKLVGTAETVIKTVTVTGMTYSVGDVLRTRLQVTGSGTSTLSAKVWKVGTTEPTAWQVSATDTQAALQSAGGVGLQAFLSGTATNAPVVASFANLLATTP